MAQAQGKSNGGKTSGVSSSGSTTSTAPSTSDVSAQIETIRNDISKLTQLLGELTTAKVDEARTAVNDSAQEARRRAQEHAAYARSRANDAYEAGRTQVEEVITRAEETVRRQPALSLGVAAGVGFLLGLIATRRS